MVVERRGYGNHDNIMLLAEYKQGSINDSHQVLSAHGLFRCVVGSRASGLDTDESDTDRRGIYLPPADLQWSLYGVLHKTPDCSQCGKSV